MKSAKLWALIFVCGCHSLPAASGPDWLVDALVEDGEKRLGTPLDTMVVRREIPIGMPLAQARAIMERHGFSCWSGVPDTHGTCLHCTAYRHTPHSYKILVKLFYDTRRKEITSVEAMVDYDVYRKFHSG